jgi:hypothetical protein
MKRNVVAVVLALLCSTVGWAANITDGGFESGVFSPNWTLGGACVGIVPTSSSPCYSDINTSTVYAGTYSGRFGAQPDPMTLTQSVTVPAGAYILSFQLALTTGTPKGNGVFTPANFLDVSWGGASVGYLSDLDAATWAQRSFLVNSTGAATNLMFTMRQDLSGDFFLDEISLDSAVPEPATLWLMGLGLACVGLTRRKKA